MKQYTNHAKLFSKLYSSLLVALAKIGTYPVRLFLHLAFWKINLKMSTISFIFHRNKNRVIGMWLRCKDPDQRVGFQ